MTRSEKGRALFYTRDSGGKHEMTPGQYVNWAAGKAKEMGLVFDGNPEAITEMIARGQSHVGDLFLDYDVSGNQLSRHGLNRLMAKAAADPNVSHVFIPRRDRFARPDDPLDAMTLEASLLRTGVTLVFMDRIVRPIARGQRQDIAEMIGSLVDYHRAGQDRQELARKILFAQLTLAKAGYSIGGRPPYGFSRWLVREVDQTLVRQLEDGERVRTRGQHVVWMPLPDDHPHMVNIRRILEMLESLPASRVAATLTAEGVPSPDSDRWRKDNGVRHRVSGVWHQSTIMNIARNPLLLAVCQTGRRSMGDQLRHSPDGPRPLADGDYRVDGKPKVVRNPDATAVIAPAAFLPIVDPDRHRRLLDKLNARGSTQRGKPRSRDPARNPLGSRIFDLNCTWPLYRVTYGGSFRYTCGAYMQSHGAQCAHNHIDGPTATRFVLSCLVQKLLSKHRLAKLRSRLRELAIRDLESDRKEPTLRADEDQLAQVEGDLAKVNRNLAFAESEDQYRAIAEVFAELTRTRAQLQKRIDLAKTATRPASNLDAEVDAAMDVLERLPELAADHDNLAAIGEAFRLVNVRLFLGFASVRVEKRTLNKVARGVITFGAEPPPVPLYDGPTGRRGRSSDKSAALVAAGSEGGVTPPNQFESGREGNSLGNVSRGDWI